jgi:hypothetical protein
MSTMVEKHARPDTAYYCFGSPRDQNAAMSPISRWLNKAFAYTDLVASKFEMFIPPGSRMLRVLLQIDGAWTDTTEVIVGDGTDDNGWLVSGAAAPGTPGLYADIDAAFPAIGAKFYADGDTLEVAFVGIASAGKAILWAEVISYHEAAGVEV